MSLVQITDWKNENNRLVFTNGCFDILHPGHIQYLNDAAALGDKLIVGLNSDSSVRQIKGPHRPIFSEAFRLAMLEALRSVDAVILFSEETPLKLIQQIKPDFLVKGGDYRVDQVVGAEYVQSYGGEVRILSFVEGYSTSAIINQITQQEHDDNS